MLPIADELVRIFVLHIRIRKSFHYEVLLSVLCKLTICCSV